MKDQILGEIEKAKYGYEMKRNLDFLGKETDVIFFFYSRKRDEIIDAKQHEAYAAFMNSWDSIKDSIANEVLRFYNKHEKYAWGPDEDDPEYSSWWPDIDSVDDLSAYIQFDSIVIPEDFFMDENRLVYVLFDRKWGGEDLDDNGIGLKLVNEKITKTSYKDIAY